MSRPPANRDRSCPGARLVIDTTCRLTTGSLRTLGDRTRLDVPRPIRIPVRSGSCSPAISAASYRAGMIRRTVFSTSGLVLQLQTSSWPGSATVRNDDLIGRGRRRNMGLPDPSRCQQRRMPPVVQGLKQDRPGQRRGKLRKRPPHVACWRLCPGARQPAASRPGCLGQA